VEARLYLCAEDALVRSRRYVCRVRVLCPFRIGIDIVGKGPRKFTPSAFVVVSPTLYQIPEFKTESKYTVAMNDGLADDISVVDPIKEDISYEKIGLV